MTEAYEEQSRRERQDPQAAKQDPQAAKQDPQPAKHVTVAIIGKTNVGKTTLTNWLFDGVGGARSRYATDHSKSSELQHTEAFSLNIGVLTPPSEIKHAPSGGVHKTVVMDVAGSDIPAPNMSLLRQLTAECGDNRARANELLLEEMKRQESFIRDVAFAFADVLIIVIDQLSSRDQQMILDIIQELNTQQNSTKRSIIIVHNVRSMKNGVEFNHYIDVVASSLGTTVEEIEGVKTVHGEFGFHNGDVRHYFLCQHIIQTGSADYLNRVVNRIRLQIDSVTPKSIHVLTHLADKMTKCLEGYVRQAATQTQPLAIRFATKEQMNNVRRRLADNHTTTRNTAEGSQQTPARKKKDDVAKHFTFAFMGGSLKVKEAFQPGEGQSSETAHSQTYDHDVDGRATVEALGAAVPGEYRDSSELDLFDSESKIPRTKPIALQLTDVGIAVAAVPWNAELQQVNFPNGTSKYLIYIYIVLPGLTDTSLEHIKRVMKWSVQENRGCSMVSKNTDRETLLLAFDATVRSVTIPSCPAFADPKLLPLDVKNSRTTQEGTRPLRVDSDNATPNEFSQHVNIQTEYAHIRVNTDPLVHYATRDGILTLIFAATHKPFHVL